MEANINSGWLAFLLDSMFRYGSLWIFTEQLQGVRGVMQADRLDISFIDQAIANGHSHMTRIHGEVQVRVTAFHLLLGYCENTEAIIVIDDELD